jgi:hypothetical protein
LNAFDGGGSVYNIEQQMIMGIQPPPVGPTIKVSTGRINMAAYVDQSSTATFTVKGVDLTGDVTVTLNDESGYLSDSYLMPDGRSIAALGIQLIIDYFRAHYM